MRLVGLQTAHEELVARWNDARAARERARAEGR